MAGDWIKMRIDLMEDPAVMQMADELGIREEAIVGYCHALWSWVSRQCHADTVTGVTLASLGRRINLPGFPELMCDVGWLEYDESGDRPVIRIPNWDRHLSQSAKKRANDANRQANRRKSVTQVSRSSCDNSVTREEKRREEKNIHSHPQAEGFAKEWTRWCEFRLSVDGRHLPEVQAESILMELHRRGPEKAKRDIDFSIQKGARSILDSDHTFEKRSKPKTVDLGI
jgi:hypothetical protein